MQGNVRKMQEVGVTPVEKILEYDGLGFLKAIIDGTLPKPPIADLLGFDIVEAEHGKAVFEGLPEFRHYNPIGTVHGGLALTLLDSAMGSAVMSTLEAGWSYTTAQLSIHLVRSIAVDAGTIVAKAKIVHRGKRVATAEGTLVDAKGNLLAHGTTTCVIMEPR